MFLEAFVPGFGNRTLMEFNKPGSLARLDTGTHGSVVSSHTRQLQ